MPFDATGGDTADSFGIGGRGRIRTGGRAGLIEVTGDILWVPGDTTPLTGVITATPGIGGAGGALMEVGNGCTAVGGLYTEVFLFRPESRRKLGRGIGGLRVMLGGVLFNA